MAVGYAVEIHVPGRAARRVVVVEALEVGRAAAGIRVDDDAVSRRHVALAPVAGGLSVVDLGSSNGTRVNGEKVDGGRTVGVGDRIELGATTIAVVGVVDHDLGGEGVPATVSAGMAPSAASPAEQVATTHTGPPAGLTKSGEFWTVTYAGESAHLRDTKGLVFLARLLARPHRELHALDLVGDGTTAGDVDRGDAGALLDEEAKAAYRKRLAELDQELDEADADNDPVRAERAAAEREFLVAELARAVGLGGRDRKAGAASERARASVSRALKTAIDRIAADLPALGDHLRRAVRTGTYCVYDPDPQSTPRWDL